MINCTSITCNGCAKKVDFEVPRSIEQAKDWCMVNGWTVKDIYTICGDCVKRILTK